VSVLPALTHEPVRRQYVDWLRGIAVLLMIMWHSIDAWHEPANRGTGGFLTVAFLAGWPAPLFLFLAGLSMALAGSARLAAGFDRSRIARRLARRGWQVFLIAHLFRLQSFLLNPNASWNAILKPDILNVLGLGMVFSAWLWRHAVTARDRVYWLLLPAVAITFVITPLAPTWWWPTLLYPRLEAYIRPVGNQGQFSLFPAIAFVVAGAFAGTFLGDRATREAESRFHRMAFGVGLLLMVVGIAMDAAPGLWTIRWNQPAAVVTWRCGAILALLAVSFWWLSGSRRLSRWHPLLVFGQTSLFIYWVHVELSYGSLSYALRQSLTFPSAIAAYVLLTVAMYVAALLWRRRPAGPLIPPHLRAPGSNSLRFRGHPV
jgi:uncharacterized membrane protein